MSMVVFGAQGQIGRELMTLAQARGLDIRGLSHIEADITDGATVKNALARLNPTLAVNCAAYTAVDRAEHDTELANRINIDGAEIVASACASANIPLVHLSTDYVFDGEKKGAYLESDTPAPINAYGRSKLAGENGVRAMLRDHVILRTSWVYSAHGSNFVKTILRLAGERDELRIVNDQYGCPTAAIDVAEAILAASEKLSARENIAGIYHFASPGRTNWCEFAREIVAQQAPITGRTPKVLPIATSEYLVAAKRPLNSELSSERFAATFGYRAKPWRERVHETIAALLAPDTQRAAS
jgi:dTDP-4-dehydrorhamnose reductase